MLKPVHRRRKEEKQSRGGVCREGQSSRLLQDRTKNGRVVRRRVSQVLHEGRGVGANKWSAAWVQGCFQIHAGRRIAVRHRQHDERLARRRMHLFQCRSKRIDARRIGTIEFWERSQ